MAVKKTRHTWAQNDKDWIMENWKRVSLSDESYFFVQGQVVKFMHRSAAEKLSTAHIQQLPNAWTRYIFWVFFIRWRRTIHFCGRSDEKQPVIENNNRKKNATVKQDVFI